MALVLSMNEYLLACPIKYILLSWIWQRSRAASMQKRPPKTIINILREKRPVDSNIIFQAIHKGKSPIFSLWMLHEVSFLLGCHFQCFLHKQNGFYQIGFYPYITQQGLFNCPPSHLSPISHTTNICYLKYSSEIFSILKP